MDNYEIFNRNIISIHMIKNPNSCFCLFIKNLLAFFFFFLTCTWREIVRCDFYFPISLLWCCHDFVARASVRQQSANGVLIRSWEFVLITVSHVFCAPFLQLIKSEAYLTKRLVNLFLVTGELGTFCHRLLNISRNRQHLPRFSTKTR